MALKLMLKTYDVNEDTFNKILDKFRYSVELTDKIQEYKHGYQDKEIVYFNDYDTLIIKELYLDSIINLRLKDLTNWKQCIVQLNMTQKKAIESSINGTQATAYINEVLSKYYTDEEKDARMGLFEAEYNEDEAQYHFLYDLEIDEYKVFKNCYYYDINGAHLDALCEIFPKAKKDLEWIFKNRKKDTKYKKIPNFYVGNLVHTGHRKTYNWIVQRTTNILMKAIIKVGGQLIYANTDGFLITMPENSLDTTTELGGFKFEAVPGSNVYLYQARNYYAMQYFKADGELETKGSILYQVRDKIDLLHKKVVDYDRVKDGPTYKAKNIKIRRLK